MRPVETVIADLRDEAAVLRRNGHVTQADTIDRVLDEVTGRIRDFLEWISEGEAQLRSGRGPDYFRARRQVWEEDGFAKKVGRRWYFRRCVVERRKLTSITREEARRGKIA